MQRYIFFIYDFRFTILDCFFSHEYTNLHELFFAENDRIVGFFFEMVRKMKNYFLFF